MHLIDGRTDQVVPASTDSAARHEQQRKVAV